MRSRNEGSVKGVLRKQKKGVSEVSKRDKEERIANIYVKKRRITDVCSIDSVELQVQ